MYYLSRSGDSSQNPVGAILGGGGWGETRYLNEFEWGTHGSALKGTNIQKMGERIGAPWGFATSHTGITNFINGTVYTQSWYQPKY